MSEPQETRKPNRFRITSIMIAVVVALICILTSPLGVITQASATYPIGPVNVVMTLGTPTTVINNTLYNGPTTSMVQLSNGSYLSFVREGFSHVGVGDYGVIKTYTSTNGSVWAYASTLVNITHRDARHFVSGITQTGRICGFYSVYDCDNATWVNSWTEYIYSDDEGISWSANETLSHPNIDGFVPTDMIPHGEVKQIGASRIALTVYTGNGSGTHIRFVYSDDDGTTWSQNDISTYYPLPNIITEADLAYLNNGNIVVFSRIDNVNEDEMFTSTDYGLTWTDRGTLIIGTMVRNFVPSLSVFTDTNGQMWVLALFVELDFYYTYAESESIMSNGLSAWITPILETGLIGILVKYASALFDSSGHGLIMASELYPPLIPLENSNIIVLDVTVTRDYTNQQIFIIGMVNLIGVLFAIGMVAAIAMTAIKPLKEKKQPTVEHLINMMIFIVLGMVVIGTYYSMFT